MAALIPAVLLAATCGSSSETSAGPTPVKCSVSLSLPLSTIEPAGGQATLNVSTSAECAWTATSSVNWITGLTPATGQGQAQVRFQVAPNPNANARQGDITLNDVTARVSQMGVGCQISLDPPSRSFESEAASATVGVTAPAGCSWSAASNDSWIAVTAGANGSGNGTVTFSVAANSGAARAGTIGIGGQTFVVTQSSPTAQLCDNTIQPASTTIGASGGTANVLIQADPSCSWTAASNVAWLAVVGVGAGSGNGQVTIGAQANTGAQRTGTMTIAGRTFTVTQPGGCIGALSPTSQSIASAGGAGQVGVTIATGCAWTAASNASWLTITSGASGTGNGQVGFSAAANSGSARSGTLTIAGQTFTVNQAGSCATAIDPTSFSAPATAASGQQVSVTTAAGCAWTATSNAPWLTITNGASGSGSGTVTFSFAANSGPARTGTLTIGGQTFTVNQAGSCSSSIAPTSLSAPASSGTGQQVAVTTAAGCAWNATSNATWLTITNGASGSGNGTVTFSFAANTGPERVGTLAIAGQTFTVTQANGCTYTIKPNSHKLSDSAQTAPPISVTTSAATCTWTAVANDNWITIIEGASGTGDGTVRYSVTRNTGPKPREGTITIAGLTFRVTQDD